MVGKVNESQLFMNHSFSKIWIVIILVILIAGGILAYRYWAPRVPEFTYQAINVQGFSIEIIDGMEKFMEDTKRLPNSYLILYAHPVEEVYEAMIGIGWDTKAVIEAAKITTVLDYLDVNVKGFKKVWGGSDYIQVDAGTLTIKGHRAKFVTYTYVTQKGLASKVKLIGWLCEPTQRYHNMVLTSPREVWDKYAPTFEHAETTMKCHESCDDGNPCTQDIYSYETDECTYIKLDGPQPGCSAEVTCGREICKAGVCQIDYISNCCGNKICEVGEVYPDCVADCPNCDDNNDCTKDSYDYHQHKCVNTPILDVICCGNGVCETGEAYQNCPRDCPNCDDDNKCTKDSYDYHQRKCLNEIIIPCCGNGICDKDAETYSNCPADCPSCDDNNRLTADSFNYKTQKCENIVTHFFIDDFEKGTQNWIFYDAEGKPTTTAWTTMVEDSNTVLKGTGHNWAQLRGKQWDNYIYQAKFKRIQGDIHFNYRLILGPKGPDRYFIGFYGSNSLVLNKQIGENFFHGLAFGNIALAPGWHTIEIRGYDNILNIYIDNNLLIKYKDTNNPVLSGGVAFETLENSEFLLDDVEIKVITEKDIIYP